MAGYGSMPFESLNHNFWWAVGIVSPHIGAILGGLFYMATSNMRDTESSYEVTNTTVTTNSLAVILREAQLLNEKNAHKDAPQLQTNLDNLRSVVTTNNPSSQMPNVQ